MSSTFLPSKNELLAHYSRIKESGALGRSPRYEKLLQYLIEDAVAYIEQGESAQLPKEIDIAIEVFDKEVGFDNSDASIRVYISKLRKKLDNYYQTQGQSEQFFISIPTGSYRLSFTVNTAGNTLPVSKTKTTRAKKSSIKQLISLKVVMVSLLILALLVLNIWQFNSHSGQQASQVNDEELWQELNSNGKQTLIVLGDRFVFWEKDSVTQANRLILDLKVHNADDFHQYLKQYPEKFPISKKLPGRFLEQSSAFALQHIMPLFNNKQQVAFRLSSELTAADMKNFNIVYIGGYHYLNKLTNFFQGSNFEIERDKKLLINKATGQAYSSNGAYLKKYTDHGLFAKYNGPNNNIFYLIVGYSDSAILHMANYLTNAENLQQLQLVQYASNEQQVTNIELVFKVESIERTGILSELVYGGAVNTESIWRKINTP